MRTPAQLLDEAIELEAEDRAALAVLLLESLEPESEEGLDEAWTAEVRRRMAEIDSGAVKTVSWEEVGMALDDDASASTSAPACGLAPK
jgi:putative addiction module component (TIGR02574 family)